MKRQLFVNLAVKDLDKSMTFFRSLGFEFNPQFTGPTGACMIISDENYAMLLTHDFFQSFAPNPIADATKTTEVLNCLSCTSRAEVDELVKKAVAAGGKTYKDPQVHGEMMYGHGFQDLDGHCWELMYMAPAPETK